MRDFRDHLPDGLLLRLLDGDAVCDWEVRDFKSGDFKAHLAACDKCHERLEQWRRVTIALEDYSASLTDARPVDRQRSDLLLALHGASPRSLAPRGVAAGLFACAAAVLLAIGIWRAVPRPAVPAAATEGSGAGGFISLPYSDENLSPEGAVVLEVEVPRSALLLAGMPAGESPGSGRVKAEVVVGADGLARAIRFLN